MPGPRLAAVTTRWLLVLVVAAALVGTPIAVSAWPAADSSVSATQLAARIEASDGLAWSGLVQSSGALQLPSSDSFAGLADLLGADHDLRVWWRGPEDWRIDRIHSTGETDLFRQAGYTIRWEFETLTATGAPVSRIRLPDVSDLVPAVLARAVLTGARADELARLPARKVAGVDAVGLRLTPEEPATTLGTVDIWADPATGLPLRVELTGLDGGRPALTTAVAELRTGSVDQAVTIFGAPPGSTFRFDQAVDVAAEANALTPYDLPEMLAGLASRTGDPGSAGIYGRGPTFMIALRLRGQVAGPLRARLRESTAAQRTPVGTLAPVGPVGLLVTPGRLDPNGQGGGFLLAGTVTPETLQRAAAQLLGRR